MAAPTYNHDLVNVDLAETTTGWSAYGGGASGLDQNADISMQGTYCVGKQISGADKGQYFDNGSGITLPTNAHVWVWHFCGTPGLTDSFANKGASVLIGTGGTAYCQFHIEGNNTYGASGRVARCYPIDYSLRSASTGLRSVTGSPGANPQVFGGGLVTTASVKGFNVGIDAIRYGTGAYLKDGELIANGDASDNPCTFAGFNFLNDANDATNGYNRWGILTAVGGGYELQGRFVIGQDNTGTAAKCNFEDSDRNLALVPTRHAAADFTQIIIDHASTLCNLTNINITTLTNAVSGGTSNPGRFIVNSANPTVNITGGTWTGLGITTLRSNTTVDGLTWRLTDQITTNGASLDNFVVDRSVASSAVVTANLNDLTNGTFISDGTGHAVELTSIGTGTMTWDCVTSGYVTGTTGSPVTPGSTGNETIYVNVGSGTLTINVASGATIPSIRSAGATVNVVAGQVPITVTVLDATDDSPIQYAHVRLVDVATRAVVYLSGETDVNGEITTNITYSSDIPVEGWVRQWDLLGDDYTPQDISGTIESGGFSLTVKLQPI